MTDRQRESIAKFFYDMAKGIGLIAVVGGMVGRQTTGSSVIFGLVGMSGFFLFAYWLEGRAAQ